MLSANNTHKTATIIGAGLAGSECALQLANHDFNVTLYEQKPIYYSTAHKNANFAELVCSNSLGRYNPETANGTLIQECMKYNSHVLRMAYTCHNSSATHLNVDRDIFSKIITDEIKSHPNIKVITEQITDLPKCDNLIIATGPLTEGLLYDNIGKKLGADMIMLSDATSPIISAQGINKNYFEVSANGDLSQKLTDDEFDNLVNGLVNAKTSDHYGAVDDLGLLPLIPIENLAKTNLDHLANVRLNNKTLRLRAENLGQSAYSIVGFMTHITHEGQRKIIRSVKGLENATFIRYGRVHRNTFVNAPLIMDENFHTKDGIYIIGQLSGVDCYVPVISTAIIASQAIISKAQGKTPPLFPLGTMMRGFQDYITTPNPNYSPMVADFSLIKQK